MCANVGTCRSQSPCAVNAWVSARCLPACTFLEHRVAQLSKGEATK